jgi:hypothetical protein
MTDVRSTKVWSVEPWLERGDRRALVRDRWDRLLGPMTWTAKSRLAWLLGAAVALALTGIVASGSRVDHRDPGAVDRVDDQEIRNLHHARYLDGLPVLELDVAEGVLRRSKVGVFRIGFTRELVAKKLSLEVHLGRARAGRGTELAEIGQVLDSLVQRGRSKRVQLTSVAIDDVALQLLGLDGARLEIRADELAAGIAGRGRIGFRGDVSVRLDDEQLAFATLDFDPASGSFVDATPVARGSAHGGSARPAAATHEVLQRLNCFLDRLMPGRRGSCTCGENPSTAIALPMGGGA